MSEKSSFFAELKRRNVYKVAVAYIVAGWALSQGIAQVFPVFDVPNWAIRVIVLLIIVGLPIALVLAWMFEMTPQGIKRTETADAMPGTARRKKHAWIYVVTIGALCSIGLFFLGRYSAWNTASATHMELPAKSIAVLPFDNLSRDPDNAYFTEGVQDEILTRLAKVGDLKVISRTSTQHFKSAPDDLPQIAKQLGVAHVLEGSVQRANDQIRVNVQLINAVTDAHLWADTFDRKLTDIFAVESEIAKTIADTLQAKLTGSEKTAISKKPTENPEAHELYLKGRHFWDLRTEPNLIKALGYFQQAIEKDPSYALAYTGVADCYSIIPNYSDRPPKEDYARALAAAHRAIELDDSLAEAHTALANALGADLQFAAAEVEFKRAFALDPNYASAHQWYGEILQSLGRFDESIAELQRARDLDPLSLIINTILASVYYSAGRNEEALQQLQRAFDLDPNFGVAYWVRGQILETKGEFDKAIEDYKKSESATPTDQTQAMIACVYARSGRVADAQKILNQLMTESQHSYVSSYALAEVQAMLGNKDEAIRLLEKAYDERSIPVGGAGVGGPKIDSRFDSLRDDPRFQKLLAKFMGEAQ